MASTLRTFPCCFASVFTPHAARINSVLILMMCCWVEEPLYLVNRLESLVAATTSFSTPLSKPIFHRAPKLIIHKTSETFFPIHLSLRQLRHEYLKRDVKLSCNSSHKVCLVYHVKARSVPIYIGRRIERKNLFFNLKSNQSLETTTRMFKGFSVALACKFLNSGDVKLSEGDLKEPKNGRRRKD